MIVGRCYGNFLMRQASCLGQRQKGLWSTRSNQSRLQRPGDPRVGAWDPWLSAPENMVHGTHNALVTAAALATEQPGCCRQLVLARRRACPTVEWVERIQGLLQSVKLGASLTIQTWFRLLGKLTAASAITQVGLLHLRPQHGASSTQMGHDRGHSQVTCGGRADFCCMVFLSAQSQRGKRR
ncbi:unnamed protein product [Boreogadus saida]